MLGLCHLNSLSKTISTHHNRHLPALITRLSSSESWALNNSNINHVGQSNPGHYSSSAAPEAMNKQNRDGQSPDSSAATQGMNGQNRDEDVYLGARVPMKGWQRAAVAIGSALGALMNPARADLVAALGETTGTLAFDNILKRMRLSPEGRRILSERPRVTSVAVGHAWELPPNTFGAAYAKFMGSRNFSPDDRPPVRFMNSEELAYVATRAREIHDFWHVLFDLPTNVIGESALKIVEFQQTFLPMCFLSVVGGSIRLKPEKRDLLVRHYLPWALKAGMNSNDLMCIYYEKYLHEDLEQVRQMWGIIVAPSLPRNKFTQ